MSTGAAEKGQETALVVGGTRGIGAAVAQQMENRGWRVVVSGSTKESVSSYAAAAEAEGRYSYALQSDATKETALEATLAEVVRREGGLGALLFCAGKPTYGSAPEVSAEAWDHCHRVNLRAPFLAARCALPYLVTSGGGVIVFVSSIWAHKATYNRVAYAAAKSGLDGLVRSLAVDHAAANIRVNAVAPGFVDTALLRRSLARSYGEEAVPTMLARISQAHPLGRILAPLDVANAVTFLAGDAAKNITGQTLVVDGGVTARFGMDAFL